MMPPASADDLPLRAACQAAPPLIERLARRLLEQPLPGASAQRTFEPELSYGRHAGPAAFNARPATVVVLLYPRAEQWHLPLIVRPAHMTVHAGQISLPGGAIDPGETTLQAAWRELHEELGVAPQHVEPLGVLSPLFLYGSNYAITPWVGWSRQAPEWRPSAVEVSQLLEVPLAHLTNPRALGRHTRSQRGVQFGAPHFAWQHHRIWGATSMILAELVTLLHELEDAGPRGHPPARPPTTPPSDVRTSG